jgi:lipopolysaccharide transport system permease protein
VSTDPQAAAAASKQPKPLLTIRPRRSWLPASPGELWRFRELMVRFAARDITLRYRQAVLGVVWVVVVPLLGAGILSFVFGGVASLQAPPGIPYFVFTLAGMVTWTAFSLIIVRASAVLVGNAQLVGKVYFPRLLLPLSTVLSTLVDVVVSLALLVVLLAITGVHPGPGVIILPLWFLAVIALALGGGLFFGALMVPYRDIQYIVPVGIQFLLFASPVAYTLASVPASARFWFELNPLTGLLEGMRWSLIGTQRPSIGLAAYALGFSLVALVVGVMVFSRMERQFADVI